MIASDLLHFLQIIFLFDFSLKVQCIAVSMSFSPLICNQMRFMIANGKTHDFSRGMKESQLSFLNFHGS
jgi:hypothetical protein